MNALLAHQIADSRPVTAESAAVSAVRFMERMLEKHAALFDRPARQLPKAAADKEARRELAAGEKEQIIALYHQGFTCRQIASKTGRSITTINGQLWRNNLRLRESRRSAA